MLNITVLGCGSSLGVPVIGCNCRVCKSTSAYNKRTRSAIFIEDAATKILIDFGPEIRGQLIKANVKCLDGAILTHNHADHVDGISDLRVFPHIDNKLLNIYADHETSRVIAQGYKYLFDGKSLNAVGAGFFDKIKINNTEIQFFQQHHGKIDSLGIRIGDFVYSNDIIDFPEQSKEYLYNIKVWILDCRGYTSNHCHAGLDRVIQWNQEFKPKKIFLTNMGHEIDYHEIIKDLPVNIVPLYDGCKFQA